MSWQIQDLPTEKVKEKNTKKQNSTSTPTTHSCPRLFEPKPEDLKDAKNNSVRRCKTKSPYLEAPKRIKSFLRIRGTSGRPHGIGRTHTVSSGNKNATFGAPGIATRSKDATRNKKLVAGTVSHIIYKPTKRSMGLPYLLISWGGLGGQCRHIFLIPHMECLGHDQKLIIITMRKIAVLHYHSMAMVHCI